MNNILTTALATAVATGLLLTTLGASAADAHKCKAGEKWNPTTSACVKAK